MVKIFTEFNLKSTFITVKVDFPLHIPKREIRLNQPYDRIMTSYAKINASISQKINDIDAKVPKFAKTLLFFKVTVFIAFYLVGILFYSEVEGWNVLHILYFSTATITTVGYGKICEISQS